eukprot:5145435-Prymnesium_polylepis.1
MFFTAHKLIGDIRRALGDYDAATARLRASDAAVGDDEGAAVACGRFRVLMGVPIDERSMSR